VIATEVIAGEIGLVILDERLHRSLDRQLEFAAFAGFGGRDDQRPILGADGVIGRDYAGPGVARGSGAVDVIENAGAGAEREDRPPVVAVDRLVLGAARARYDR